MGQDAGRDQVWVRLTPKQKEALASVIESILRGWKIQKWVMDGGYLRKIKEALDKAVG